MRSMRTLFIYAVGAIVCAALLIATAATTALAETTMKLIVDGEELQPDVPPQVLDGRTMVPLRWVAEALGASCSNQEL